MYHSQGVSCSLSGIKPSSCSYFQHVATSLDHVIPRLNHEAADLSDVAFQQPASAQSSSQLMQPNDVSLTGNLLHETQRDFSYDKNDVSVILAALIDAVCSLITSMILHIY